MAAAVVAAAVVAAAEEVAAEEVLRAESESSPVQWHARSNRADREPRSLIVTSRPGLERILKQRRTGRIKGSSRLGDRAQGPSGVVDERRPISERAFSSRPVERCSHEASDHDDPPRRVGRVVDPGRAGGCRLGRVEGHPVLGRLQPPGDEEGQHDRSGRAEYWRLHGRRRLFLRVPGIGRHPHHVGGALWHGAEDRL